jgi:hypothetical protein
MVMAFHHGTIFVRAVLVVGGRERRNLFRFQPQSHYSEMRRTNPTAAAITKDERG